MDGVGAGEGPDRLGPAELGFARASETLRGITGIKVMEEKARVEDGVIVEYLVTLEVIFLLDESEGD